MPIVTEHVGTHLMRSHRSPISFSLARHFSCHCTTFSFNSFCRFFSFFSSSNLSFSALTSCLFSRKRFRSASEWAGRVTIWPRSFEASSFSCKCQQIRSISNDTQKHLGQPFISLKKQQFVVTHTIHQTDNPAVVSWISHEVSVKMLCPQVNFLSLYFCKNLCEQMSNIYTENMVAKILFPIKTYGSNRTRRNKKKEIQMNWSHIKK